MKNLSIVLVVFMLGFSLISCIETKNKTYVEQSFNFNNPLKVGTIVVPVPVNKSLDDLILGVLKDNGYKVNSVSSLIESGQAKIVCFYDKIPKEYALQVDGKKLCVWRHINILKKTSTGYLSKNIEFSSY